MCGDCETGRFGQDGVRLGAFLGKSIPKSHTVVSHVEIHIQPGTSLVLEGQGLPIGLNGALPPFAVDERVGFLKGANVTHCDQLQPVDKGLITPGDAEGRKREDWQVATV